jgi:hypothetical protein
MALTLVEAAKANSGDVVRSSIIELFARNSDVLRVLPFTTIPGNAYKYTQEQTLPGIAFRGVNEGYTESTGVLNPETEQLTIVGGDLDVDRFIVSTMGNGVRAAHVRMKVKALASTFSQKFIKGDSATTAKEFDGLQTRLTGNQVVSNSTASSGAALSLFKLDEAIDAVDEPNYLLMTKAMARRLNAATRTTTVGGQINFRPDEFGRRTATYNDLPILIADRNADANAQIDASEAYTGGGTADGTSIYVLSLMPSMLSGIENGTMDVRDLGETTSTPVFRTRVEWYVSILLEHPRAAARLRDVDVTLAVTA